MKQIFSKTETELITAAFDIYAKAYCKTLPTDEELKDITFSEKFIKRMEKLIRRQSKFYYKLINTAAKRVACYVVAILITAIAVTFSVEALRVPFLNFITKVYKTHTDLVFNQNTENTTDKLQPILPSYIPEGFEELQREELTNIFKCVYENKNKQIILYRQHIKDDNMIGINTEYTNYEKIYLKDNNEALLMEWKGEILIVFTNEQHIFEISSNLPREEIIKIAESVNF